MTAAQFIYGLTGKSMSEFITDLREHLRSEQQNKSKSDDKENSVRR